MVPANFNQLYYFWVIAKAGSISTATKRLYLTQSTLSLQIQNLEASLGKQLFHRSRHGVSLTPEGQLAFDYCERIFNQADELLAALRGGAASRSPAFRLGVNRLVSREKLIRVSEFIQSSAPQTSLRIFSGSNEDLAVRMERGMADMLVCDVDLSVRLGKDYRSRLVYRAPLYFVATPAVRKRLGRFPAGLIKIPLLLRSTDSPARKDVDHFLHRNGITPAIHAELEDTELLRTMALEGRGAAVMDASAIARDLKSGKLQRLHRAPIGIYGNIWFLAHRHRQTDAALGKCLDSLMTVFDLSAGGNGPRYAPQTNNT